MQLAYPVTRRKSRSSLFHDTSSGSQLTLPWRYWRSIPRSLKERRCLITGHYRLDVGNRWVKRDDQERHDNWSPDKFAMMSSGYPRAYLYPILLLYFMRRYQMIACFMLFGTTRQAIFSLLGALLETCGRLHEAGLGSRGIA